ncbi:uncharacterized protein [Clytia hemisphaerica]|uniref:Uncharacterized protein n=1 Tax=Clytia hemisphaerica TaxID=252671 RepID=A0A7M5V5B5_9CNID
MYESDSEPDDPNDEDFVPGSGAEETEEEEIIPPTPKKAGKRKTMSMTKDEMPSKKMKEDILLTDEHKEELALYNERVDSYLDLVKDESKVRDYIKIYTTIMHLTEMEFIRAVVLNSKRTKPLVDSLLTLQHVKKSQFPGFRSQIGHLLDKLGIYLKRPAVNESSKSTENSTEDLTLREIDRTRMKQKELLDRLHPYSMKRQKAVFQWKQKNLLRMDDFIKIGSSDFALNVACVLEEPEKFPEFNNLKVTDLRNMYVFHCHGERSTLV